MYKFNLSLVLLFLAVGLIWLIWNAIFAYRTGFSAKSVEVLYPAIAGILASVWLQRTFFTRSADYRISLFQYDAYYVNDREHITGSTHPFDQVYHYTNLATVPLRPTAESYLDIFELAVWEVLPLLFSSPSPFDPEQEFIVAGFLKPIKVSSILNRNSVNQLLTLRYDKNGIPFKYEFNGKVLNQEETFVTTLESIRGPLSNLLLPIMTEVSFSSSPEVRAYSFESPQYKIELSLRFNMFSDNAHSPIPPLVIAKSKGRAVKRVVLSGTIQFTRKSFAFFSEHEGYYKNVRERLDGEVQRRLAVPGT